MAQTHKLGTRHTTVTRKPDGTIRVTYHSTDVVTVHANGNVTLDTGGWRTATTKTRMNQAANQFGLNYQVHQDQFNWYVTTYKPNGDKSCCFAFDDRQVTFGLKTGRKVRTAA